MLWVLAIVSGQMKHRKCRGGKDNDRQRQAASLEGLSRQAQQDQTAHKHSLATQATSTALGSSIVTSRHRTIEGERVLELSCTVLCLIACCAALGDKGRVWIGTWRETDREAVMVFRQAYLARHCCVFVWLAAVGGWDGEETEDVVLIVEEKTKNVDCQEEKKKKSKLRCGGDEKAIVDCSGRKQKRELW